jgi:hypothetical protein
MTKAQGRLDFADTFAAADGALVVAARLRATGRLLPTGVSEASTSSLLVLMAAHADPLACPVTGHYV